MRRYPQWLKQEFSPDHVAEGVRGLTRDLELNTVCESARCPNLRECHSQRQLTFMILGERCTRACRFCAVDHRKPEPVQADEPWRVAEAVRRLKLDHVVITSVARDDLPDEGAGHFARVIRAVRAHNPGTTVEILVPDFHGRRELISEVMLEGRPEVFSHNIETVERLTPVVRHQATYERSLDALAYAASLGTGGMIKSGMMLGLGERAPEVEKAFADLLDHEVSHLTLGQYLRPDASYLPVMEYVSPARFDYFRDLALRMGFRWVRSGPFVRSSYHAVDALQENAAAAAH